MLWLPWKTQQIHVPNYLTYPGKNNTSPQNQNLQAMVFMWRLASYAINSVLAMHKANFPRDAQRTEALGTNQIRGMIATKWPYRGTKQRSLTSPKPPIFDSYTVTFVEQPSFDFQDTCEDNGLTN